MEHLQAIIIGSGYIGIFCAVFAESGLFFGAFLPGDSLLFTAGLFASQGEFKIILLWVLVVVAAITGDSVGYAFGRIVGPRMFSKEDSLLFRRSHILRAKAFYERHGKKAIVMARFVPIVRTFAPIVAGIATMRYRTFFLFNVVGGVLWGTLLLGAGYSVGRYIPGAGRYLEWIIIAIIVLSIIPIGIEYLSEKRRSRNDRTPTA